MAKTYRAGDGALYSCGEGDVVGELFFEPWTHNPLDPEHHGVTPWRLLHKSTPRDFRDDDHVAIIGVEFRAGTPCFSVFPRFDQRQAYAVLSHAALSSVYGGDLVVATDALLDELEAFRGLSGWNFEFVVRDRRTGHCLATNSRSMDEFRHARSELADLVFFYAQRHPASV